MSSYEKYMQKQNGTFLLFLLAFLGKTSYNKISKWVNPSFFLFANPYIYLYSPHSRLPLQATCYLYAIFMHFGFPLAQRLDRHQRIAYQMRITGSNMGSKKDSTIPTI